MTEYDFAGSWDGLATLDNPNADGSTYEERLADLDAQRDVDAWMAAVTDGAFEPVSAAENDRHRRELEALSTSIPALGLLYGKSK